MTGKPSYHDLYVTTKDIPRTKLFNLPYGLIVMCSRVTGWELVDAKNGLRTAELLGGEYEGPDKWLVLDVSGHVITDSRPAEVLGEARAVERRSMDQMASVRLEAKVLKSLRLLAQKRNSSVSDLVREAIDTMLRESTSP